IVALMAGPAALLLATTGVAAGFPLWTVFGSGGSLLQAVVDATGIIEDAPAPAPVSDGEAAESSSD
ncbi:MAG: hypothetical protein WBP57_00080, partial [Ignavibacteria bacterium]